MFRYTALALLCFLSFGVSPARAVKDIVIDPESGEVEILRDDGKAKAEEAGREVPSCQQARRRVGELEGAVRKLQKLVLQQRRKIKRQKQEIERQDNVIRGLDQLLRRQ